MGEAYYKEFLRDFVAGDIGRFKNDPLTREPTHEEVLHAVKACGVYGLLSEFENWLRIEKGLK